MHYSPVNYFTLTFVGPRTRTRQPYPHSRRRRRHQAFNASVAVPTLRRTATLAVSLIVADGSKYRVRIQQTVGTVAPTLVAKSSSFNVSK